VWQIRSRIQREVTVSWIANQKLVVKRGMTGATGNIYVGLHEFADMMFVLHALRRDDLFLDIGANVGAYTVLAAGVCNSSALAFEPDPKTVVDLKRNIEVNGLENLVTVHNVALGATEGEVSFTVGLDTVNRVVSERGAHYQLVQQRSLDSVLGDLEFNTAFAKIDVEGYEEEVLRGAEHFLAKQSVKAIELETVTQGIQELLSRYQFERAFYDPFRRLLSRQPVWFGSSNALFVKDFAFVCSRVKEAPKMQVLGFLI
jgi:FkbM family methyltransferase